MLTKDKNTYQLGRAELNEEEKLTLTYLLPNSNVLEIGCNAGYFSEKIKRLTKSKITGVDIDYRLEDNAKQKLDHLIIGDIEDPNVQKNVGRNAPFDFIILLHVIEHLKDPWSLISNLNIYLKDNGKLICATPNIANWNSRALLFFKGRWRYEEKGVMDRTHLRFFTKDTIIELVKKSGMNLDELIYLHPNVPVIDNLNILYKYRDKFIPLVKKILPPTLWATTLFIIASKGDI